MNSVQDGALSEGVSSEEVKDRQRYLKELISKRLILGKLDLPMMPHVATKVLKLTSSLNFSFEALTRIIVTDQVISSKVLRIANSAYYSAGQDITSLHQAIVRLGYRCITNLVISSSLSSTLCQDNVYGAEGMHLWDHSVACAFCAKEIAEHVNEDMEEAFLVGLIHDIGKLVYIGVAKEFSENHPEEFNELGNMVVEIRERLHANMGGFIARRWDLPKVIQNYIRYHHDYENCIEGRATAIIVCLADNICNYMGYGLNHQITPPWEHETTKLLKLDPKVVQDMAETIPEIVQDVRSLFHM